MQKRNKKQHIEYYAGQHITVFVKKPQEGKFPIAIAESGIVCLFKKTEKKIFLEYNSTWTVEIDEVHKNKLIVVPVDCITSPAQEESLLNEKLNSLRKEKPVKKKKERFDYPYDSKNG